MSDMKPRRPARETGRREPSDGEAARPEAVPPAPATAAPPPTAAAPPLAVPDHPPASVAAAAPTRLEPAPPPAVTASPRKAPAAVAPDAWALLAEMQAAFVRGFEQAACEVGDITRAGMAAASDAAVALIGAKTLTEAIEINAGLTRQGVDAMIEGSARLSEIGAKTVSEASRPILARFGDAWSAA
jgi:Phasin protein